MRIVEVKDNKDLKDFISLPWKIYKDYPHWVPPLKKEVEHILNPQKNPFWEHAEHELFIVKKEGKTVGRIAAIVDQNHNNFHQEKMGFFGFFECIPDYQVAELLLNRAREGLKEKGMQSMRGPVNPSMNEECGLLLEGFDSSPTIMMPYTPEYYLEFMERFGLKKSKDLLAYFYSSKEPQARVFKLLEKVKNKNITIRNIDLKKLKSEIIIMKRIFNSAWEKNWGFVPMTDKEAESLARTMKPLGNAELIQFAEMKGEPVGFSLSMPDYNQVLKHLNGKFGPIELLKFLYYRRKINMFRLMVLGVEKEYRNLGIELLLYFKIIENAKKLGMCFESSWTLEDNTPINKGAVAMGGTLYKKYRFYEKQIQ